MKPQVVTLSAYYTVMVKWQVLKLQDCLNSCDYRCLKSDTNSTLWCLFNNKKQNLTKPYERCTGQHMPIILALGRLWQEFCLKFAASLSYVTSTGPARAMCWEPTLKIKTTNINKWKNKNMYTNSSSIIPNSPKPYTITNVSPPTSKWTDKLHYTHIIVF